MDQSMGKPQANSCNAADGYMAMVAALLLE